MKKECLLWQKLELSKYNNNNYNNNNNNNDDDNNLYTGGSTH